jgi:hypothetical protein
MSINMKILRNIFYHTVQVSVTQVSCEYLFGYLKKLKMTPSYGPVGGFFMKKA